MGVPSAETCYPILMDRLTCGSLLVDRGASEAMSVYDVNITIVPITPAMKTVQPDHTDDDWKLLDEDEMDPNQLEPKPPFIHASELTPLPKYTQARGDLGTKVLTNEEGWEVVDRVKYTTMDR